MTPCSSPTSYSYLTRNVSFTSREDKACCRLVMRQPN